MNSVDGKPLPYPDGPLYLDGSNRFLTEALFLEAIRIKKLEHRKVHPIFSLSTRKVYEGLVPFYQSFVEIGDPTGYKWAEKYLGSWEHYVQLLKCSWFKEVLDKALDKLEAQNLSQAIDEIKDIAANPGPQRLAATRYLAEKGWKKGSGKTTVGRGRPTKQDIDNNLKEAVDRAIDADADLQRILQPTEVN